MGRLLWESPPDARTLDKSSATNRCDIHTVVNSSGSSSRPIVSISTSANPSTSRTGSSALPYDYIYAGSRPIRRHLLDPASDSIEIEDLQNERDHESRIRERELERERERERERDRDRELSVRIERTRRERGERRSAHMERFLNANYHTPQLPTTSTTSQRPRPHMIQPNSDQLLTLSEFLRDTSPGQSRREANTNNAQTPTSETSAIQQWLGLRGSNATRSSTERREAWERALSPGGIPSALTPASAVLSPSNAAATISNPPSTHRRSQSTSADWPPSSPLAAAASVANRSDSFQTLVNQIRRIGALQDYMLNSVDESAASLEESLNLHSQALTRAINSQTQALQSSTNSAARESGSSNQTIPDVNSQSYYTSLRVREARIRTMQSRIDLLASEFALLRTTRRELRRAETEALGMFQSSGAIPPAAATSAIEIPTVHTPMPRDISRDQEQPIRTEVDEVEEALDAEGNSNRRVLRSTFLPAELGDETILQFERETGRSRVRDTLAEARREIEAEQARSMEVMQEARRMIAARTNASANATDESIREEATEERRRRASVGSIGRSQSERRA